MPQLLHLVSGGEPAAPQRDEFRGAGGIDIVGVYPGTASACAPCNARARAAVDDAHVRDFIAHLHRLPDAESAEGPTEPLG